jgi:hypothetical protein
MVGSLVGDVGGPRAPTTYLEYIDGGPPCESMPETQERLPPILKTLMAGSLGGDARDPEAPTTYLKDVDGMPPWGSGFRPWSEGVL